MMTQTNLMRLLPAVETSEDEDAGLMVYRNIAIPALRNYYGTQKKKCDYSF